MTLYQELLQSGCEVDHHESDLYVKATAKAQAIVYRHTRNAARFCSALDGSLWWDVPFAYDPFWELRKAK